jgi:hypothetical protein
MLHLQSSSFCESLAHAEVAAGDQHPQPAARQQASLIWKMKEEREGEESLEEPEIPLTLQSVSSLIRFHPSRCVRCLRDQWLIIIEREREGGGGKGEE